MELPAPAKGETITADYLQQEHAAIQRVRQEMDALLLQLTNLATQPVRPAVFPVKIISGGTGPHTFQEQTVNGGVFQSHPSGMGCDDRTKPYAGIGLNNMLIASATYGIGLRVFDGVSERFCLVPAGTPNGPFPAVVVTSATGSFPTFHYQVQQIAAIDSSQSANGMARYVRVGAILSATNGLETAAASSPYTHGTGVSVTASGVVGAGSCHILPIGPYAMVSVTPLVDIFTGSTVYKFNAENSGG